MDIKILVVTHKDYWMPNNEIYLPILVGNNKVKNNYLRDNTGDNISKKNKNYCELTALYWAWKNLDNKYIGLCHYRRYFSKKEKCGIFEFINIKGKRNFIMKKNEYENILKKYDIILPKKLFLDGLSVKEHYEKYHNIKDLETVRDMIKVSYKEDLIFFDKIMKKKYLYPYNMFVMNKKFLDEYCIWLFNILFELEKRIDISNYDDYQTRVYGFLSERLFNVWVLKKNLKIYENNIIFLEKSFSFRLFIKRILFK